ncbi:Succinate dehydrogenase cytochrome b558 subunit [Lentibacillus sp. JNUCC-1]|nr:Succinate dehydrogenase cytochrome b558 subunit [Lentibacillus sp. JNUCC-1]
MAEHRDFFYRRLHSLLGVIPIGVFLTQHLIVNHFAVYGEDSFNKAAGFMESLPFRLVLETFIIFLPILFHAILGFISLLQVKTIQENIHFSVTGCSCCSVLQGLLHLFLSSGTYGKHAFKSDLAM